jgi:hypothetical protein
MKLKKIKKPKTMLEKTKHSHAGLDLYKRARHVGLKKTHWFKIYKYYQIMVNLG